MAIQHHKRLSMDLLLPTGFGLERLKSDRNARSSVETELEPFAQPRSQPRPRKGAASPDLLDAAEQQRQVLQGLRIDGQSVRLTLTATGLEWARAASSAAAAVEAVPFSEMLSAECCDEPPGLLTCLRARTHQLQVLTFRRAAGRPCEWFPRKLLIEAVDEETVQDLCAAISRGIEGASAGRPRSLLVLLNPNSGHRQGRCVWCRLAAPVFAAAGIKARVWETRRPGHACELVAGLTAQQLQGVDGIVCVGGDGVFHEALNGLMAARGAAAAAGDAELAALLGALRLAHIPAGSTDAVACTLHGTRRAFTAALHVALGDSTPLDVLRVDTPQGAKFASCIAAYGFLADVTSEAEQWRWMGPMRYDIVGAAKLAVSRAYPARIRYLEGEVARTLSKHSHTVCTSDCRIQGEFCSIMLIVMPCRSDKTRSGMARFGHLADGRLKLVLVRKCSPLQYLRFLHGMSRRGCSPGQLPYVTVLDAVAVEVTPLGSSSSGGDGGGGSTGRPVSCWNLDGELVAGPGIQAEVHPGLVRVFSRGVEQA
ncbi:hypothetical protein ABPG75_013180 [Micractinium tetrahymenae]